jgi:hypothetical protein
MITTLYLNDMARGMLEAACLCLEDTETGVPASCFVSHGSPPDDCCDYLAISLMRVYNSSRFPAETEGGDDCSGIVPVASFQLKLMRPCYPTVVDDAQNPFPAPADINAASELLLIDARVLWCCVTNTLASGGLTTWPTIPGMDCPDYKVGRLTPVVGGGCAGWTLPYLVELDSCCGLENLPVS